MFPITPAEQMAFFNSQGAEKLILIISNKTSYLGAISLSNINRVKKICGVALVVDDSVDLKMSPFISLEAMARITEHAFNVVGINRIEAGQHIGLGGWQQRMELLGYRLEGLHMRKYVKGREVEDSVTIACLYEDFKRLTDLRGELWDSRDKMESRIRSLPRPQFSTTMTDFFDRVREEYYESVFKL